MTAGDSPKPVLYRSLISIMSGACTYRRVSDTLKQSIACLTATTMLLSIPPSFSTVEAETLSVVRDTLQDFHGNAFSCSKAWLPGYKYVPLHTSPSSMCSQPLETPPILFTHTSV